MSEFKTLYRRDSNDKISYWQINSVDSFTGKGEGTITIEHGKLSGKAIIETITTGRNPQQEAVSRYNSKIKQGYVSLADIKDNCEPPVKGQLHNYLLTYLPVDRTTGDGSLLPMLAEVYDNTNNRIFKRTAAYLGQYKINGLRCFIRCVQNEHDLFEPIKFTFQSREGTYWNSLNNLNDYLLMALPREVVDHMLYDDWILDGELYIPGFTVNEINHIVKDSTSPYNKYIQFWCYDLYIESTNQLTRINELIKNLYAFKLPEINTKDDHLNIKTRLNVLPVVNVDRDIVAENYRNKFIDLGFEGLIMRNSDIEYQTGKRRMIKYKRATDGKFKILDIIPEGIKRPDIAKFVCQNDINDELFECKLSAPIETQKKVLKDKEKYISKYLFIEYGERAGVKQVPFHIKKVRFIDD